MMGVSSGNGEGVSRKAPVVARVEDDRVLLDPRTVLPQDETDLLPAVKSALAH